LFVPDEIGHIQGGMGIDWFVPDVYTRMGLMDHMVVLLLVF